MSNPGGEERRAHADHSHEKVTLSLPAEFFQTVTDEFEFVLHLLDSQQAVFRAAEEAQANEVAHKAAAPADEAGSNEPTEGDRLNRLVCELLGKDLDALQLERAESHRRTYSIAASDLYRIAELIGAQSKHRLDRLSTAFDLIAAEPVRRELARRQINESAEKKRDADANG